jgi:hypothetical protein
MKLTKNSDMKICRYLIILHELQEPDVFEIKCINGIFNIMSFDFLHMQL